jgi:hypothetical protein
MLYTPKSKFIVGREVATVASAPVSDDGQVLVTNATAVGAFPSTGAAGEVFLGFSFNQTSGAPYLPATAVKVEEFVPSGTTYTVQQPVVAGSLLALKAGVADSNVGIAVGNSYGLTGLTAGATYKVVYTYALTAAQAIALVGNVQPGQHAGVQFNATGVAEQGIVYVSNFDTSVNYNATTVLVGLAGGKVGVADTDDEVIIKGRVVELPTVEFPFLGIEFNAL